MFNQAPADGIEKAERPSEAMAWPGATPYRDRSFDRLRAGCGRRERGIASSMTRSVATWRAACSRSRARP
jgi:hypothetical protein